MRTLITAIFLFVMALQSKAQDAPLLTHSVAESGELTLSWPVHVLRAGNSDLAATYHVEIADVLPDWRPIGSPIVGANGPNRTSSVRFPDLRDKPASYLRVRAVFDFTGRNFPFAGFTNSNLSGVIFYGVNLFAARLDDSILNNANLAGADLRSATMINVVATNANFRFARIADADLSSGNYTGADFSFAELAGVDLTFSDLSNCDLRGAILEGAIINFTRFHGTRINQDTVMDTRCRAVWDIVNGQGAGGNFTNLDLSFTDLRNGNLTNARLQGADLTGVDFNFADLSGANLSNATLRQLDLRGTILSSATVIPAKWRTIADIINNPLPDRVHAMTDLSQGFWIDAMFKGADIHGSDFNFAIMADVNFNGVKGQGAIFRNVEFHGSTFRNADLRNANFSIAILNDVDFTGANLTGVNFAGARFSNVTMPDGSIRDN